MPVLYPKSFQIVSTLWTMQGVCELKSPPQWTHPGRSPALAFLSLHTWELFLSQLGVSKHGFERNGRQAVGERVAPEEGNSNC